MPEPVPELYPSVLTWAVPELYLPVPNWPMLAAPDAPLLIDDAAPPADAEVVDVPNGAGLASAGPNIPAPLLAEVAAVDPTRQLAPLDAAVGDVDVPCPGDDLPAGGGTPLPRAADALTWAAPSVPVPAGA